MTRHPTDLLDLLLRVHAAAQAPGEEHEDLAGQFTQVMADPATGEQLQALRAQAEADRGLREALDTAIQCETDVLDIYQRRTSLQTLDLAVAELKRDSLPKLKAVRAALAQAGGETQPEHELPAWGLETDVVYVGPNPGDYPNRGPLRVIPSMHAHLTRVSDGRAEFSAPHAHFAQAQAGAAGEGQGEGASG